MVPVQQTPLSCLLNSKNIKTSCPQTSRNSRVDVIIGVKSHSALTQIPLSLRGGPSLPASPPLSFQPLPFLSLLCVCSSKKEPRAHPPNQRSPEIVQQSPRGTFPFADGQ